MVRGMAHPQLTDKMDGIKIRKRASTLLNTSLQSSTHEQLSTLGVGLKMYLCKGIVYCKILHQHSVLLQHCADTIVCRHIYKEERGWGGGLG
jgi:hypothetical protein